MRNSTDKQDLFPQEVYSLMGGKMTKTGDSTNLVLSFPLSNIYYCCKEYVFFNAVFNKCLGGNTVKRLKFKMSLNKVL